MGPHNIFLTPDVPRALRVALDPGAARRALERNVAERDVVEPGAAQRPDRGPVAGPEVAVLDERVVGVRGHVAVVDALRAAVTLMGGEKGGHGKAQKEATGRYEERPREGEKERARGCTERGKERAMRTLSDCAPPERSQRKG